MEENLGFDEIPVNAGAEEVVTPQETEQVETTTEPVNAGKEEVTTLTVETKPVQDSETNAKFAEVRRKAESEARDKVISEMYGEEYGIHTYADYQKALAEQQRQEELERLTTNNIPEDVANEIIESRQFRQQYEAEQKTKAEQLQLQKNYEEFIVEFPDVKADSIPSTVWEDVAKGKSLVDAYAKYENKQLKDKLKVFTQNETNKSKAPIGGVSTHGSQEVAEEDDFLKGFNSIK